MHKILTRRLDTKKVVKSYNRLAAFYDVWGKLTETKAQKAVIDLADINDHQVILDVGCGTGRLLKEAILRNPHGTNFGLDSSESMLKRSDRKLKKHRLQNYTLHQGSIFELPIDDNSIDILLSTFLMDLLPEDTFDQIAESFFRKLKSGGVVVIAHFSFGTRPIHQAWYWIARHFPGILTGCRPIIFQKYLENAGFTVEQDLQISQNTFPAEIVKARKPD